METTNTTYRISAKYFYYEGTLNVPKNGPLKDNNGENLSFDSRKEALEYITNMFSWGASEEDAFEYMDDDEVEELKNKYGVDRASNGAYYPRGTYYLAHGEYSQPEFKIIKNK